jgi:hypothetical protein
MQLTRAVADSPESVVNVATQATAKLALTTLVRSKQYRSTQTFRPALMKTLAQRRQKAVHLTKQARRLLKASMKFVQQRWAESDRDKHSTTAKHVYEIRPRANKHGVDLISDALPYSPLWYRGPNAIGDAINYAKSYSRSHDAVIRVYDEPGNVIETHEQAGEGDGRYRPPPAGLFPSLIASASLTYLPFLLLP